MAVREKGFSLVEMIVVIAIFTFITGIVLFNYANFSTNVTLQNLTQDVALSIRKAQVYALGIKTGETIPGTVGVIKGYGVHFDVNNPKSFIIFADKEYVAGQGGNRIYDARNGCGSTDTECVEKLDIQSTDCLYQVWYKSNLGTTNTRFQQMGGQPLSCFKTGSGVPPLPTIPFLDITFTRPNPDATFCSDSPTCPLFYQQVYNADWVAIEVASAKGLTKTIYVYPTGLITIADAP